MEKIMKFNLIILMLFVYILNVYGQKKDIYITVFNSLQEVDERIVGMTDRSVQHFKTLNKDTPPDLTRHYGIGIGMSFYSNKGFSIVGGLNYSYERNNYIREFIWHALRPQGSLVLSIPKYLDVYGYYFCGLNMKIAYMLKSAKEFNFELGVFFNPNVRFKSFYQEALVTHEKNIFNKWEFYSIEFNPFVGIQYKRIELDLYYRLFYIKKIDRAIFKKYNTGYGAIENDFEIFNPVKFGVSIKYWFDLFKNKKSNNKKNN